VSDFLFRQLALRAGCSILSPVVCQASRCGAADELVAFAGRLVPEKGVETLIRAVASLSRVKLEIAGDGPMRPACERLVLELGLDTRVRFRGWLSLEGVRDLYERATVVAVPSLWGEPFGYAAAEAMALGRAVVASDGGSFAELLASQRGWLCPPGDVNAWARTLAVALDDPQERSIRGERAAAFVRERLDPTTVASQYVHVYESQ
jgi:glycosyltransferase involved in cell wall biosynthesis